MVHLVYTSISASVLLLSVSVPISAAPQATSQNGQMATLVRRRQGLHTDEEWGKWAKNQRDYLLAKYDQGNPYEKRSSGTNLITNQNADSSYFGSLAIGTPPKPYYVILDTGSADLWVAGDRCDQGCESVERYKSTESSTFKNGTTSFKIQYGSGAAVGSLGTDIVQMAGFAVKNQVFAVCNEVSENLLTNPVSGLMGLAFRAIASSKAMPFWQTLVMSGAWDQPLMAFHLTRFVDAQNIQNEEPGGSFSMGFTNSSLYTGDIDYVDLATPQGSYWLASIHHISVNGNIINFPASRTSYAAIDTGTTLIGGPSAIIDQIFAQIPGSTPGKGDMETYYTYPCNTTVNITMSFGGKQSWSISPSDFQLTRLSKNQCLGAFFKLDSQGSAPSWIVGDTFLKNVYSVFRYSPPSIGFARLSDFALAENGSNSPTPTPTLGPVTTVSASIMPDRGGSKHSSNGSHTIKHHHRELLSQATVIAVPIFVLSAMSFLTNFLL
ncbi:aspartic peptidase A1 [Crepidotus variabilis]|uniref:Aspartic peptidase A1 n=1 Tax=Crepidotus variabilis TaxID=179855 RepID=A0A9P6EBV5_9AGAR|nr:aspartic peptidase A1 [Crepidotus variabilis]